MRLKAGDHVDRFEIIEPLGEGAYAETYKARDTASGQIVLLKSPNPLLFADPAIHQRFVREAEIARSLNHPGVQRSIDLAEHRSEPYLALEYIEGENLRRWLRAHPTPLPLADAVRWGTELAEALDYLHRHHIVHRDLKPENLIVTRDGHLKIIDFGTALLEGARRLTWRHLTEALGTPDYMSPEQIQGERGDQRSDLYAWGILMYEFLTGHVPFQGDNYLAVMAGHLQRHPQPIREVRPEVPADLEAVVLTAMRRYADNRYQTAGELLGDLRALRLPAGATPPAPSRSPVAPASTEPPPAPPASAFPGIGPLGGLPARSSGAPVSAGAGPTSFRPSGGGAPAPTYAAPAPVSPPGATRRTLPPPAPLRATARDLGPEKPIGRLPAPQSKGAFWGFVGLLAGGFIALVAVIILLSVVLRH
ncbi:MAG TPA: serine/threonine-protein kinase [Actinomycetota bacterium]|nr:serine/threonine-protein kinase [Actinomycetota bacterium]